MKVQELEGAWWVVVGVVLGWGRVMGCHSGFLCTSMRVWFWVLGFWEGFGVWIRTSSYIHLHLTRLDLLVTCLSGIRS